jgi:tryptophan-rich sensory protein
MISVSKRWRPALVAGLAAFSVASIGGLATDLSPWYFALQNPTWKPPDWLFGPAWTVIFALIAVAGYKAWQAASDKKSRTRIVVLFAINGLLNVSWSVLFFTLKRPDWALVEVVFFWFSIVVLIVSVTPLSRAAGWLLVPYLTWVTFAGVLNLEVVQLNAPF